MEIHIGQDAVLVTAASCEIGRHLVLRLAALGIRVFAGVRTQKHAEVLIEEAQLRNIAVGYVIPLILDVTVDSDIIISKKIVDKMMGESGSKLIGIVNNAGYAESGFLETSSMEATRRIFEVNVFAQIALTQAFLPLLRKAGGHESRSSRVIFVSSVAGVVTMPGLGAYCASRHALECLNDAFRMELKSWNIDVVCIEPGRIGTNYVDTLDVNIKFNELLTVSERKYHYHVEDEVIQRYAKFGSQITLENKKGRYGDVTLVSNKILQALYDSKPLHRYSCGIDAGFLVNIMNITPLEVFDLILGRVTLRK